MAAKTPSKGIDQNQDGKFIDKYWGRVPQFLKYLPEAYICDPNPEYVELIQGYIDGTITEDHLSKELYTELEKIVLNIGCPCLLTGKERAIMNAFLGNESCPAPSHTLTCGESVCCNEWFSCTSPSLCEDDNNQD